MTAAGQSVLRCSPGALRRVGVDVPTAKVIAAGLLVTCIAIIAAAKKVSWMIERSLVQRERRPIAVGGERARPVRHALTVAESSKASRVPSCRSW
jgi:hypothetical protein